MDVAISSIQDQQGELGIDEIATWMETNVIIRGVNLVPPNTAEPYILEIQRLEADLRDIGDYISRGISVILRGKTFGLSSLFIGVTCEDYLS